MTQAPFSVRAAQVPEADFSSEGETDDE